MSTVQQDSADFLDDIPKHIFKQVNHFIHTLARVNFLYLFIRHNKAYVYAHNFSVSFFHLQEHNNPIILMGVKQLALTLF